MDLMKTIIFLVDLSIHSGKNRFFIYDFSAKKVIVENLVTHGSCDQFEENPAKWEKVKFDSRVDSHCSMKGKYKIGNRDYSSWGINVKYWLHGLESTNKSAEKRVVVLHSWNAVKNKEVYPRYAPLSWGCPAVSNEFMEKLDIRLQDSEKPVLLWIID
jgi:L,D-transpeptidase catalytic domain